MRPSHQPWALKAPSRVGSLILALGPHTTPQKLILTSLPPLLPQDGDGRPDEPQDYRCCGGVREHWTPEWEVLEGLSDPWGYGLNLHTVRIARAWLSAHDVASEGEWEWHPVNVELRSDMTFVLRRWPGEVCAHCWAQWPQHDVPPEGAPL